MEQQKLKTQQGYLSIISVAIIVVVALASTLLVTIFHGNTKAMENFSQTQNAFYLANSGLQIANRFIIANKNNCNLINKSALFSDQAIADLPGQYRVNSYFNSASTTLHTAISDGSSTAPIQLSHINTVVTTLSGDVGINAQVINLVDANNLANSGMVKIDNEYIAYVSKNGDTLQNLTRGAAGTTITNHHNGSLVVQGLLQEGGLIQIENEVIKYQKMNGTQLEGITRGIGGTLPTPHLGGSVVKQNQCSLIATSGTPTLAQPTGKCLIQATLLLDKSLPFSFYSALLDKTYTPALVATGCLVVLSGSAQIINKDATLGSPTFPGSSILASRHLDFNGGAKTIFTGGFSTYPQNNKGDIIGPTEGQHFINQNSLYSKIFAYNLTTIKNMQPKRLINPNNFTQAEIDKIQANEVVVIPGNLEFTSADGSLATKTSPKIIIIDGDFKISGKNSQITLGQEHDPIIVYVKNDLILQAGDKKTSSLNIYGLLYVQGNLNLKGGDDRLNVYGFTAIQGNLETEGNATIEVFTANNALSMLQSKSNLLASGNFTQYELKERFN